jgi:hypothetical protein
MRKNFVTLVFLLTCLMVGSAAAAAQPNLSVLTWQGPSSPVVESPYQYTARVRNIGNKAADNVRLTVDFPLTNTSPTRHILGKLSGIPANCAVSNNKLQCNLGSLAKNQTKTVTFTFELQVATTVSTFTASATTTSLNEADPNNNSATLTPSISYPSNPLTSANVLVTLCSGTNLSSFYECELYPSSQQSFTMTLNSDNTITIPDAPTYGGMWNQLGQPLDSTLYFAVGENNAVEAEFNGFAVSSTCFEGITTFTNNSGYNAAYRVCEQ